MEHYRINALGAEAGFPPGLIEKVVPLGEVAALVARHLLHVLALKCGT